MDVLVIFTTRIWPLRSSQRDHLWSFKKYIDDSNCYYLNIALFNGFPSYLKYVEFDLIIFDWTFVGQKNDRPFFKRAMRKLHFLKESEAKKICLPQDEFTSMDLLCDFINDYKVDHVFSVAPASEWPKIYKTVDQEKVKFKRVLTGYLDEEIVEKYSKRIQSKRKRNIDIGYRTVSNAIWGRFNLQKAVIAKLFQDKASSHDLNIDIKVGEEYFKMGNEWLEFLADCKYTLGIEGGSKILDWDGTVYEKVHEFLKYKPQASFDDLASSCIPIEREGEVNVVAISPRHLEACLTKTVQILVEGEYNGILKPNVHYIPLKKDYSNVDEIIELINNDSVRSEIADRAYNDIVASSNYTYRSMVQYVIEEVFNKTKPARELKSFRHRFMNILNKSYLYANLSLIYLISRIRDVKTRINIMGR